MGMPGPEWTTAWNAGCDARLAGRPVSANPYSRVLGTHVLSQAWREGWRHVEQFWGVDARKPVEPLREARKTKRVYVHRKELVTDGR